MRFDHGLTKKHDPRLRAETKMFGAVSGRRPMAFGFSILTAFNDPPEMALFASPPGRVWRGATNFITTIDMDQQTHGPAVRPLFHTSVRRGLALAFLFCGLVVQAQLVTSFSRTIATPKTIDGGSERLLFDFSSTLPPMNSSLVQVTLSVTFGKSPSLSDDPPFYSEIGLVLRKLSPASSILTQVTLIETGSFNDGDFGTSFSGTLIFDDHAVSFVNSDPDQLIPGVFKPENPLSAFNGGYSPYWELVIDDGAQQNPLTFSSTTLTVFTATAVPEPSSTALAGATVLGLAILFRHRRFVA
jgi:hypothetical protein